MLFSKDIVIETRDSRSKVLKKLREVIETRCDEHEGSTYRGEFVKEGFILVRNTSVGSFIHLWVFGKFVKTEKGTNIEVSIRFDWKVKAIFVVINVVCMAQLAIRLIRGVKDSPLFLGFLVFAWTFFFLQSHLETNGLKRTIEPLFADSKEVREEPPKSLKGNNC